MALENYAKDMKRCARCSVCKYVPLSSFPKSWRFAHGCPAIEKYKFHTYSGSGKLITALAFLEKRIEPSDSLTDVFYKCTLCGMCDTACKVGTDNELWEAFHEFRTMAYEKGWNKYPEHKAILDSLKSYDNVWGQPRTRRKAALKKIDGLKDLNKEKAEVAYFVGCTYSLDPDLKRVAQKTAAFLLKAGYDMGTFGAEEKCCASPAYMIGDMEFFHKQSEKIIDMFHEAGVKTVVTSCAGCLGILKGKYPRVNRKVKFKVKHTSEMLAEAIKKGRLEPKKRVPMSVTFHDPCHLGRMSEPRKPSHGKEEIVMGTLPVKHIPKVIGLQGVYDAPRKVLTSIPGVRLEEMERIRECSWCCGAGGGVKSAFPDFALDTAAERLAEAEATGAETLVTTCPWCEKNFMDAAAHTGSPLKIVDAVDLLEESLG